MPSSALRQRWLKRYHPVPFMAAILNSVYGNPAKIAAYIQYCRSRGIAILPPDVNRSQWKFTVAKAPDGQLGILFGLGAVKYGRSGCGGRDYPRAQERRVPRHL